MIVGRSGPSDGHSCAASTPAPIHQQGLSFDCSHIDPTVPQRDDPCTLGPRPQFDVVLRRRTEATVALVEKEESGERQPAVVSLESCLAFDAPCFDFCRVVVGGRSPACQQHRKKRNGRGRQSGCHLQSLLQLDRLWIRSPSWPPAAIRGHVRSLNSSQTMNGTIWEFLASEYNKDLRPFIWARSRDLGTTEEPLSADFRDVTLEKTNCLHNNHSATLIWVC